MKIFLFLAIFLFPSFCFASVVINEIAWMGTETSSYDEWIELKNTTENDIDLANWKLISTDGSPEINLTGIIPAYGYFLLERTDDNSVLNITADLIYSGTLSNTGERLELKDDSDNFNIHPVHQKAGRNSAQYADTKGNAKHVCRHLSGDTIINQEWNQVYGESSLPGKGKHKSPDYQPEG